MSLPRGVHAVVARGRHYFYFQAGRGTPNVGERIKVPNDPHSPEFWQAIRHAQGLPKAASTDTISGLIAVYLGSPQFRDKQPATQDQYRRCFDVARTAWGALPSASLLPHHVQAMMDRLAETPAAANNFLTAMQALSAYARPRQLLLQGITEGVRRFVSDGGHKPWTPEQLRAAHDKLTGVVRCGIMLYLYTGQRGSDVVRIGFTDIDDGGFNVRQRKTGREVWCPRH